jgi:hypothetical protein
MESGILTGITPRQRVGVLNAKPPVFVTGLQQMTVQGLLALAALRQNLIGYHLYVSLACPWAHRTMIYRQLKGLGLNDFYVGGECLYG